MQGHTEIALAFYSLPRIFKDVQVDIASIQPAVQPRQPAFLKGKGYEQVTRSTMALPNKAASQHIHEHTCIACSWICEKCAGEGSRWLGVQAACLYAR